MAQKIYLFRASKHLTYAVIASSRKIAYWYRGGSTMGERAKFIGMGTGHETGCIIACAADRALKEALESIRANGGSDPIEWPKLPPMD